MVIIKTIVAQIVMNESKEGYMSQLLTFNEWRQHGYTVIAGQSSVGRNDRGQAVFNSEQITPWRDPGLRLPFEEDMDLVSMYIPEHELY